MSIGNAIVNQALGAANKSMMGGLKKVMGNLPGSALGVGGKVSGLKSSGGGSINLSYPLDVEQNDAQGHYIMFMINTADPATVKKEEEDREFESFRAGFLGEDQQTGGIKNQERFRTAPKTVGYKSSTLAIDKPATVRLARAISLYMPPSIKSTYNTAYVDTEMGAVTTSLNELFNDASRAFRSGGDSLSWSGAGQALTESTSAIGLTLAKNTAKASSLVGAGGAAGALEIRMGKILANKMELLFTGVGRRKFSFTFTFIPKSEKEAQVVHDIVHTFKKHMMPSFSSVGFGLDLGATAHGRILSIPDSFDIQYMYHGGENPWINKISTCYLQQVDVQYGAGEKQSFYEPLTENITGASGPPPQTTVISLAFEEIEKMSRERVEEGF